MGALATYFAKTGTATSPSASPLQQYFASKNPQSAPAPQPTSTNTTPTASGPVPASALKGSLGGGYGASNITDAYSGKPLLTYENQGAKSSQLFTNRVAPTFDPTIPQKIDPSVLHNGRMPETASAAVRKATGAQPDEQLDHLISLELGGSNDTSNLNNEKLQSDGTQPSLTLENSLAKQVATGKISYIQGQILIARAKGVQLPDDPNYSSSDHPLAQYYRVKNNGTAAPAKPTDNPVKSFIENLITNFAPFKQLSLMAGGQSFLESFTNSMKGQSLNAADIDKATARVKQLTASGMDPGAAAKQALNEAKNQKLQATALSSVGPEEDLADVGKTFDAIAKSSDPTEIASLLKKVPNVSKDDIPTLSKFLPGVTDSKEVENIIDNVTKQSEVPKPTATLEASAREATQTAIDKEAADQEKIHAQNEIEEKINTEKPAPQDGLIQKLKNLMNPLKAQDPEVQSAYKDFVNKVTVGKQLANDEARKLTNIGADEGFDTINRYERGSATPYTEQIKNTFEDLYDEAQARGEDVPHRSNYLPHAYTESSPEIQKAMQNYLEKKGVPKEEIVNFMEKGEEIPGSTAKRLGIHPFFAKTRTFPTYESAIDAGLHPKYTHPAQLAGLYRETLERTTAAKQFVEELAAKGKLVSADIAPAGYKPVNLEFSPKGYYAKAKLADMLNGLFNDPETKSFWQQVTGFTGKLSRGVQKMELTTGVPGTNVNVHSVGQLIKEITSGNFSRVGAFLRSTSNKASVKFFEENRDVLMRMAKQGLDLGGTVADYPNLYENLVKPTITEAAENGPRSIASYLAKETGTAFENIFTKKNFSSFMPQLYVSTFKDATERFTAQGMAQDKADALATDVVKAFHGLIGNVGRAKGTEDGLSSVFFAPKFRESIMNTLWNSVRSVTTDISNPAFYQNRKLLGGMGFTFGLYAAANKAMTGHYIWQNPSTHQFDLQIPTSGGNYAYVPFMPTFMAVPRNLIGGALSFAQSDIKGATQQFSSVLSAPLQLFGQLYANKDFYGRAIYADTDSGSVKAEKIASYLGLNTVPPFIKETVSYIQNKGKTPLYQSITTGMELPIKYGTDAQNNTSDFYNALNGYDTKHAQALATFKPTFDKIQALVQSGQTDEAQKEVNALSDSDYALYKGLKQGAATKATVQSESQFMPTYKQIQALLTSGKQDEAQKMVDGLSDADYKLYQKLKAKGL